jgi:hypothetical protein
VTVYARVADVAVVVEDPDDENGVVVYLAPLPDGPVQVLNGVGSLIWLEATRTGASGDLVTRVAEQVGSAPDLIHADVDAFVAELLERRLLEKVE